MVFVLIYDLIERRCYALLNNFNLGKAPKTLAMAAAYEWPSSVNRFYIADI